VKANELRSAAAGRTEPRRVMFAVVLATLVVFGGLVAALTFRLREQLRSEVLHREAAAIHAVAQMQLAGIENEAGLLMGGDPIQELFSAVLESSRLHGVLAVQLFDSNGLLRDLLPALDEAESVLRWWPAAPAGAVVRFDLAGSLEAVYGIDPEPGAEPTRSALLEVIVPLRRPEGDGIPLGSARYWIDGSDVAAEFSRMDRRLAVQAGMAFFGSAALIALVLAWAFWSLAEANRRLVERSADLARANQELDFAAKTGAIGAISAHLIHGLKNPLSGLEGFVTDHASGAEGQARGEAWQTAVDTTRRLRALVNEVVVVLRDEEAGLSHHAAPVVEVVEAAARRAGMAATNAGVSLVVDSPVNAAVRARVANLAGLVLDNLLANAIEASARGSCVTLATTTADGWVEFLVRDAAGGVPEALRAGMFRPMRSSKPGGGGVGLAISRQLARHAGGELELVRSDARETVFRLRVPVANDAMTC